MRVLRAILCLAVLMIPSLGRAFATVSSVTVAPASAAPGAAITVTVNYCESTQFATPWIYIAFRLSTDPTTIAACNTANQVFVVFAGWNGSNNTTNPSSGGAQLTQETTAGCPARFQNFVVTVPSGMTGTSFNIIAQMGTNTLGCSNGGEGTNFTSFSTVAVSPTFTPTGTPTATPTMTFTNSFTLSPTPSASATKTFTLTNTPTFTPTSTVTSTPTISPTATNTPVFSPTSTPTGTPTVTITPTFSASPTPSVSPTSSPTSPFSPTVTPTTNTSLTATYTPNMPLTKSSNVNVATIGDTITYCISWSNLSFASTPVTIWDTVPAFITFVGADNGGAVSSGMVIWNLGSQSLNASGQVCFWGTVNGYPMLPVHLNDEFAIWEEEDHARAQRIAWGFLAGS